MIHLDCWVISSLDFLDSWESKTVVKEIIGLLKNYCLHVYKQNIKFESEIQQARSSIIDKI